MIMLTTKELNEAWDRVPEPFKQRVIAVMIELDRACLKHPNFPTDKIHQAAIVGEESGELLQAAIKNRYEGGNLLAIEEEAVQTAAMCFRMLIHLPIGMQVENKIVRERDTVSLPQCPECCSTDVETDGQGFECKTCSNIWIESKPLEIWP